VGVGTRRPLSAAQVDEVWARWRSGQAVRVLSRQMRVSVGGTRKLNRARQPKIEHLRRNPGRVGVVRAGEEVGAERGGLG
jgi:hypothetical protein